MNNRVRNNQKYGHPIPRLRHFLLFIVCMLMFSPSAFSKERKARQVVIILVDGNTGETLPGAVVSLDNKHVVSDASGKAVLVFPQATQAVLSVQFIGYKPLSRTLYDTDATGKPIRIAMKFDTRMLDAVTITGGNKRTVSTSVAVKLSQAALKESAGKNLAEMLAQLPGVSSISTGATIMKPVIQGMHSNRVLLINNGVRQEGQQWGADHAPEVDASSATELEVIKGAESVRYGAGAIGGVILLRSASLPHGEKVGGNISLRGGTNALRAGANADFYGGADFLPHFRWRAQLGASGAGDYTTANYYLNNTGMRETSASLAMGTKGAKWEVETFVSYFHSHLGVFFGAHIGTLEDLYERFKIGRPTTVAPASFKISNPKQQVSHFITRADAKWKLNKSGLVKLQYDFQRNNREEFEIRRGERNNKPALGLLLNTHSAHAGWESDKENVLHFMAGATYAYQVNKSDEDTQAVPLIPNFVAETAGVYFIAKYVKPRYEIETGVRYDYKYLDAKGYNRVGESYGGMREFHSPTFSVSGLLRMTDALSLNSNLGLAWRAPEVNELYSHGLHHGAGAYEIGDNQLQPERGLKWNNELQYNSRMLSVSATGFVQWIGNYIFNQPSIVSDPVSRPETWHLMAGVFPVFRYRQVGAFFHGGDVSATFRPIDNLKYYLQGQWIRARNKETGGFFPYIPSDRYNQQIEWAQRFQRKTGLTRYSLSVAHLFVTQQKQFDPSIDFVPESPAAYHLFGVQAAVVWGVGQSRQVEIGVSAENIFNTLYKEYTNRFRYYAHEKGRDIQLRLRYDF